MNFNGAFNIELKLNKLKNIPSNYKHNFFDDMKKCGKIIPFSSIFNHFHPSSTISHLF